MVNVLVNQVKEGRIPSYQANSHMKQVTNLQNPFLEGCLTCAIYTVMNIKLVYKSVVYKIIHLLHCCDHKLHETTHLQGDKFSVPFSWVESILWSNGQIDARQQINFKS